MTLSMASKVCCVLHNKEHVKIFAAQDSWVCHRRDYGLLSEEAAAALMDPRAQAEAERLAAKRLPSSELSALFMQEPTP